MLCDARRSELKTLTKIIKTICSTLVGNLKQTNKHTHKIN